jgi:sugar/nucleoside kinase (ribokinase family)
VGADASAEVLLQSLQAAGVGCGQVQRLDARPTSKTVILLVEGEDRRYIHVFGANAGFNVRQIRRDWVDGLKVFYLGGLFAMPGVDIDELAELLAYCRQRGIATVLDVVVAQGVSGMEGLLPLLPYTDYFLPNDDEAEQLTGLADTDRQLEALLRHGAGTVIITRGREGSVAANGSEQWGAAAYRVKSIDPSGSGDAFAAGIITGVVRRWEMAETLRYAAALGASATMAIGTTDGVFAAEEARAFLDKYPLPLAYERQNGPR